MSRNAGKKPRGAQPRSSGGGGNAWRLPFFGGLLAGLLVAVGVYLLQILPTAMDLRKRELACDQAAGAADKTVADPDAAAAADKKPVTFDFYNMLPKQQTPVPGRNASEAPTPTPVPAPSPGAPPVAIAPAPTVPVVTTAASAPAAVPATTPAAAEKPAPQVVEKSVEKPASQPAEKPAASGRYVLQAGSFATRAEADRRRGELVLSGLSVGVQQAKTDKGETRFRVIVGPFGSEAAMKDAQKQLAGMKIDTLAIHPK